LFVFFKIFAVSD